MKQNRPSPYTTHDKVWLLLPWYVNHSLHGSEQELVRDHLRVCLTCNKELEAQDALARTLRHSSELAISFQPSFERLMSRIHAADVSATPIRAQPKARDQGNWIDWITSWMRPGPLAMAMATALFLAVMPLFWGGLAPNAPHDYRTVANPGSLSRFTQGDVSVVFADEVTEKEIAALVTSVHGSIVDGPTGAGAYTIRIADGRETESLLSTTLQRLRADKSVLLAEPALPPTHKPEEGR